MKRAYESSGPAIYQQSFATIRSEADLERFDVRLEPVVVRMIHAVGDVDITPLVEASPDVVDIARAALQRGRPIWCDSRMVAFGITRGRLPAANDVRCTLNDPGIHEDAVRLGTTRSAAAVDRWLEDLDGALAVVGNAPTSLFRLLELIEDHGARPAAVVGLPVGFVGAAESKSALATSPSKIPFLTVRGRRGGSAMAVAAVNAIASEAE